MLRTQAAADQQQTYNQAVRHTLQSLAIVDDATLVGLTRLGIAEVEALKQEVAEILPAGNLPAFLLQGLVQLKDRTLKPERVAADLRLLFQATKQIGIFGAFLAAPALALRGYQKLLALAGKDVESAFPDGPWQFYTEFGLREDAARHCAETVGFDQVASSVSEVDSATAWVYAALQMIFGYDDLLANEWDERMLPRTLDTILETRAQAEFSPDAALETPEDAQQLADAVTRLRTSYGIDRLVAGWTKIRPYRLPAEKPLDDYAAFRRAQFRAYLEQALHQLPPEVRAELDARFAERRTTDLPAYQRQMTLLMTLDPESYQDHRTTLSLHQARIALVVGGRYYLIDACARDGNGNLLIYPLDAPERSGTTLPLRETGDGALQDTYSRPVTIDRRGRVKIGNMAVGRLRPPSLESVKQRVAAILQQVGTDRLDAASDDEPGTDVLLARVLRSLGYHGPLSPVWLRLASAAIALILALVLTTGALAAARAVIRAITPAQPTAAPASTAPTLIPAETFTLDGPIEQIAPDSWLVNRMPVAIDAQTTISGTPAVGAVAHIRGTLQDNGALLARSISVDAAVAATDPPSGAPTAAPAQPPTTSAPIAKAPTPMPEPETPAPTAIPEPPPEPTPVPEPPAPAISGDLFAQIRALLVAGVADGRAGEDGKELIKKLDEGQAAFASGDLKKTAEKLRELRQKVQEKTREGKMEGGFSRQALALIDAIANTYSLNVASDDKPKDDKDKDK